MIQRNLVYIASLIIGKKLMNDTNEILNLLRKKFDKKRSNKLINYFSASIQKFQTGEWEGALIQSGKFIEVTIKLILAFAGETLPKARKFSVGTFSQKITQINSTKILSDGIRLQIPRACIFLYDITSNRGGRHDSDEFNPNEMDAITALALCSWILSEFIRFCASNQISPDQAKKIIESVIKKQYPVFEEIEGRIYVDNKKYKSVIQCALMILYKRYPNRISKTELVNALRRHKYKKPALNFGRLSSFIDSDKNGDMRLRLTGLKKVEQQLSTS